MPWSDVTGCHDLRFWMLSFKPGFSLSSFTFIKRLFSFSLLSAIRVVSFVYLRLLICLPTVLIPAWSSSPAFYMLHSAYDGYTHMMYVIDISSNSLDSSLWFIQPGISHDVLYMWWTWFEQALRVGDGSLACYSPWGHKESETQLSDWTELNSAYKLNKQGDNIHTALMHSLTFECFQFYHYIKEGYTEGCRQWREVWLEEDT